MWRAPVLAEVLHLLRVEEFVLVLAGRVLHEDGHGVGVLVQQIPTHVLRRILLPPSAQAHDVRHRILAFVQERAVERATLAGGLAEHVVAVRQTGAQRVREEDTERAVAGEHRGETVGQTVAPAALAACLAAIGLVAG